MKKLFLVMVLCGCAGVSHAAMNAFNNGGGDNSWTNTANWSLGTVPVAADDVFVDKDGADMLQINASDAVATSLILGTNTTVNSYVAIGPSGKLTLSGGFGSTGSNNNKYHIFLNEGELDVASITLQKGRNTFTNRGTIVCSGQISVGSTGSNTKFENTGTVTCAILSIGLNTTNAFVYMLGGTINGTTLQGNGTGDGGHVALLGGTMTFADVNLFDTNWSGYGTYSLDVQDPGMLVVEGQDLSGEFQDAITDGYITGGVGLNVSYIGGDTILASPVPGSVIIFNASPTNVTMTNAWLNGSLTDCGGSDCTVTVYWGDDDAGTVASNWDESVSIGLVTTDSVPAVLTGLATNLTMFETYYYRYYATNDTTNAWATPVVSFVYANIITQKHNGVAGFGAFGNATNWSPQVISTSLHDVELGDTVEGDVLHTLVADWYTGVCHNATIKADNRAQITEFAFGFTVTGAWTNDGFTGYELHNYSKFNVLGNYYDVGELFLYAGSATRLTGPDRSYVGVLRTYAGALLDAPADLQVSDLEIFGTTCPVTNDLYINANIIYNMGIVGTESCDLKSDIDLMSGTRTFQVYEGHTLTTSGSITNGNLATHTDSAYDGDLILSGENSCVNLTVNEGSVFLNGTNNTAGAVNVISTYNGTFGGAGTIAKDVTVQSNCTFNAGAGHDAIGTYNATGDDITILTGATYQVECDGSGAGSIDQVICSNLTLTGSTVDFDRIGAALDDPTYVIATYSNLVGSFAVTNNLPLGYAMTYSYGVGGNQIAITNNVGSEDILIFNSPPTNLTPSSAYANGQISATGSSQCAVFLYWGYSDGVTNPASWDHEVSMGVVTGTVPPAVDFTSYMNLLFGRTCYYRFYATNLTAEAWAAATESFKVGGMAGDVLAGDYKLLDEDQDIDTEGTFLYAVNGGGLTSEVYNINGLDIVGDMTNLTDLPPSGGPAGYQCNGNTRQFQGALGNENLSGDLRSILSKHITGPGLYIDMDVVQGQTYKLQILWALKWDQYREWDVYVEDQLVLDGMNLKSDIEVLGSSLLQHGMLYTYQYTATDTVTRVHIDVISGLAFYNAITLETYDPSLPDIETLGQTGLTVSNAWLNGSLVSTGSTDTAVFVAYGASEAGTNRSLWDVEVPMGMAGTVMPEFFTTEATGLMGGRTYYYRYFATNSDGISWGSPRRFNTFTHVYAGTLSLVDEDSDIDTQGTFLYAVNGGGLTSEVYNINGLDVVGDMKTISDLPPSGGPVGYQCNGDGRQTRDLLSGAGLSPELKQICSAHVIRADLYIDMDVVTGKTYKMQILWSNKNNPTSDMDIFIEGQLVVDGLNHSNEIEVLGSSLTNDALMYTYIYTAEDDQTRVHLKRQVGWGFYNLITLEELGDTTLPEIVNSAATDVTATNAQLNGALLSEGGALSEVTVFWGDNDAEDGSWDYSYSLGSVTGVAPKPLTHIVGGLTDGVTYYYRFYASNSYGEVWAVPTRGFNNDSVVRYGRLYVLDEFSDIDLDGNIVYAINCGQVWYTGAPTGTNPPIDGDWGDALQADRELDVKGVTFKGDLWSFDNAAQVVNSNANFYGWDADLAYFYAPQRFPPFAKEEGFSMELRGNELGQPGRHPTNSSPYAVVGGASAAGMFAPGVDEDNMEKVIGRIGQIDTSGYSYPASLREAFYNFDVVIGYKYKIQMIFRKPGNQTDIRVEVDDVICVDGLDAPGYVTDSTNEAALWSYEFVANSSTTVVSVGRSTLNAPASEAGMQPWQQNISAITLERLDPTGSYISIW